MSSKVSKHPISQDKRANISARYKRITKSINQTFWNSESETLHSIYVGSYGRGTAIDTSDLDVLFELPSDEYDHFTGLSGNGQSRLLQSVKNAILDTYPRSDVKGDGQVVVVKFSDGMVFEILPAFRNETYLGWDGTYKYPDTHMGGNWLSTNPKAEIDAMKEKNEDSNGLLYATCQHIRYIRDNQYTSYHLSGILIDSFVYKAIGGWHFLREGEEKSSGGSSFEEILLSKYNEMDFSVKLGAHLNAPGSNMNVDPNQGWDVLGKVLKYMA